MASQTQVLKTFASNFTTDPFLFFSPGRINLIGEHVDYNDGFVMPAAINKGIWFAVAPNYTETINIISADENEQLTLPVEAVAKSSGWRNYVLGVLHVLQRNKITFHGFDCVFGGNLPQGAGLSSSAAVEGGMLFAINDIFQLGLLRPTMALYAQQAEHAFPEVKCGIMDQFANMMGKKNHVILLDCKNMEHSYFPLNTDDYTILLINSNKKHSLEGSEYNTRRMQCWQGLEKLRSINPEIETFRDVELDFLKQFRKELPEEVYKKCLYVVEEIERTQQAAQMLQQGLISEVGKLMKETHKGLSQLYDVSTPELDFLVKEASWHNGVAGARLMGGGFGGCTINLVQKEKATTVAKAIVAAYENKFDITADVYDIQTGNGTHEIEL